MPRPPRHPKSLQGWIVLSLRPRGQHGGLRAAAGRQGARLLALSGLAIEPTGDPRSARDLAHALAADSVIWTSPNAVRAAAALQALAPRPGQPWLCIGSGTRRALQRAGVPHAHVPARMDSEGLLAMAALQDVRGRRIGLVTAPGGRDVLLPGLAERGARVLRADVYRRRPIALRGRAIASLGAALARPGHILLVLSSVDALQRLAHELPADMLTGLHQVAVVATSERLAGVARATGFVRIAVAREAGAGALLQAAAAAFV